MSPSYRHDDDSKLIHSTVTHSVPVGAAAAPPSPAEPKRKYYFYSFFLQTKMLEWKGS